MVIRGSGPNLVPELKVPSRTLVFLTLISRSFFHSIRCLPSLPTHRQPKPPLRGSLLRRISVILLPCEHGPDASCHFVCQGNDNQHQGLLLKHALKPRSCGCTLSGRPLCDRHCPDDQKPPDVALPHLRCAAQPLLAARRLLQWDQAKPGRKIPARLETLHRRSKCFDRHGTDRANTRHCLKATGYLRLSGQRADLTIEQGNLFAETMYLFEQHLAHCARNLGQMRGVIRYNSLKPVQMINPFWGNITEFIKVRPQRIYQVAALANELVWMPLG